MRVVYESRYNPTFCRHSGDRGVSLGEVGEDEAVGAHVLSDCDGLGSGGMTLRDRFSPT